MCRFCSVYTCRCQKCEPLKAEAEIKKRVSAKGGDYVEHIEGRCEPCNHKFWMMVSNF